jgi:hypothetical protein
MNMCRTLHRRSLRVITLIVVMAMLLAPTAALASCCCVLAKVGQATGLSTDGCCDRQDAPSCCSTKSNHGSQTGRSCCTSRAVGSPANTTPHVLTLQDSLSSPTQCECERSCCDGLRAPNVAINNESDSSRFGHDVDSEPTFLFVSYDLAPTSFELGVDHAPRFLSAPHRCATLCRWLN